MELSLSDISCS